MPDNDSFRLTTLTSGHPTPGMWHLRPHLSPRGLWGKLWRSLRTMGPAKTGESPGKQAGRGLWLFWPSRTLMTWVLVLILIHAYQNIQVRDQLDVESARGAREPGSSVRRNRFLNRLSSSSFHKIVKHKLHLHAFRSVFICGLSHLSDSVIDLIKASKNSKTAAAPLPQKKDSLPLPH